MRRLLLAAPLALASCGEELSSQQQAERDARDIAQVKEANRGTSIPIAPQAILYPDIERNEIYGTSCAFAPEGGGLGAIAIAMREDGFMKLDGKIVRFSADGGSTALPSAARSKYSGKKYAFELTLGGGEGKRVAAEAATYDGKLTVRASNGDTVYQQTGEIQCGS